MLATSSPPSRTIHRLVIHCSATPSGQRLAKPGMSAAFIIDGWHATRGFARQPAAVKAFNSGLPHIGYHYIIDLDGRCINGRGLDEVGAHVAGYNSDSIGICLVGGIEREARYTLAQWLTLAEQVAFLRAKFNLTTVDICGHRDLSPDLNHDGRVTSQEWLKTCPGFDVAAWLLAGMAPASQHIFEATP
jgi:N-acetylmuramoyl-L-alanine amidase